MVDTVVNFFNQELWILQVFIVVLVTLSLNWLKKRFSAKLLLRLKQTKTYWDDVLLESSSKPLTLLILIVGLSFAVDIIKFETNSAIFSIAGPARTVGVIIALTWFLVRFISNAKTGLLEQHKAKDDPLDETTVDAIAKLLSISVTITGVLVILQTLGYSISGVLAFGGIGGLAVGFAAKDLLANFFGGLMLYLDRPFVMGNWIRSPDKEIEGIVEKIGWRLTTIRTFDKRPLYVPNSVFMTIAVENPSRMTNRRIKETVGIRYADVATAAKIATAIKTMLQQHDEIDHRRTLIVNLNEFAPSSLNFLIYTFTKTTDWVTFHEIKQDVMLRIVSIIESHGAECAFPSTTLYIPDEVKVAHTGPK